MTTSCAVLGIARRTAYRASTPRRALWPCGRRGCAPADLRRHEEPSPYGCRRVWAMMNRTFRTGYNLKRIRRVMQLHGLMLAQRAPAARPAASGADSAARQRPNTGTGFPVSHSDGRSCTAGLECAARPQTSRGIRVSHGLAYACHKQPAPGRSVRAASAAHSCHRGPGREMPRGGEYGRVDRAMRRLPSAN